MNTFWLKIAALAVVVVGLIVLVNALLSSESRPKKEPKTIYDQWEQDDERLRADPQLKKSSKTDVSVQPNNQDPIVEQPKSVEPPKPQFRELSEIERIDAEKLFNNAIQFRKIGRLPGPRYKTRVDWCRQRIQKYPGSEYAFKAKRMIADIPEHYRERYKITDEEIDLGDLK